MQGAFSIVAMVTVGVTIVCGVEPPAPPSTVPALKGLDPVELVAGKEAPGKPELTAEHGRFRYSFASEANRAAFQKEPDRYSIQFSGACMRMGPLAGGGHPDRFLVHDGRIYIFASEGCRKTFAATPARFIDRPDEPPAANADSTRRADEILRKAIEGAGGEAVLKSLKTLQVEHKVTTNEGDTKWSNRVLQAAAFPRTFVQREAYATTSYHWLWDGSRGYKSWEPGRPVDSLVRDCMARDFYRHPVHLLKAWLVGDAKAAFTGDDKVGDVPVAIVAVAAGGATTFLAIDPASGQVLRAAYTGRAGGAITRIERLYSDFRPVDGLKYPFGQRTLVNGKEQKAIEETVIAVRVNEPIESGLLKRPGME